MSNYDIMLLNGISDGMYSYGSSSALESAGIWTVISVILAIVGGILLHFLFVRGKDEPKGKFLKWLKDFLAFKIMWIEPLLKVVYYIATIFVILFSFSLLAAGGAGVIAWLVMLVLGPVVLRVAYEAAMMFIMIWRNTRDIAENTRRDGAKNVGTSAKK